MIPSAVGSSAAASLFNTGTAPSPSNGLGRDEFLKLLTTQMRYQNPLDPLKDADFIAQLAQFSSLEGIQKLNASFADMLLLQQLTQGANLIGKTVLYDKDGSTTPKSGVVESVKVDNGKLQLTVAGTAIDVGKVRGIEQAPGQKT